MDDVAYKPVVTQTLKTFRIFFCCACKTSAYCVSHGWKRDWGIDHSTSTLYSACWFTPAVPLIWGHPKFPFHVPFSFPFDSPLTIWGKTPKPMDVVVAALFQNVRRRLLGPCSRANRVPTCLRRGMQIRTHASSRTSALKAITTSITPKIIPK